ncbi:MAG TPA: GNAT family N-acetyltransferase [Balneolales bacterium]|nr:GNAT family N-acetyltransferase [Balneolales bacterium]
MKDNPDVNGITLVSSKKDEKAFLNFPYQLYAGDKNWIPPLYMDQKTLISTKKNPFYNDADIALFLAQSNGKVAGRIAAIHNKKFNEYHDTNVGFFGFFECIDNQSVANLLFKVASDWLKERNLTGVIGPASPGTMDEIGVLIEGYEYEPSILMPYNKTYYDKLISGAGYQKEMDLLAFRVTKDTVALDRIDRAEAIVKRRLPNLKIREVNLKNFDTEVKIIREIFNKAWAKNWGFTPLSKEEFRHLAKDLKTIVDTDIAHVAEIDGKPVGFSIALPDFNQALKHINGKLLPFGIFKLLYYSRKIDRIRTALMGILPEYQGKGIDALLHREAIRNGLEKGYTSSELGWVLENNVEMVRVAERIGGSVEKVYRMYKKEMS